VYQFLPGLILLCVNFCPGSEFRAVVKTETSNMVYEWWSAVDCNPSYVFLKVH
jgi:hypothetical protein